MRTCINTLQLLARQAADQNHSSSSSQNRACRCITAAQVASNGALGLKDVSQTPLGVLGELLLGSSKSMAARLHQLATAAAPRASRGSRGGVPAVSAAIAARLQQQQRYNMLLDLAEHELVSRGWPAAEPLHCRASK